MCQNFQSEKWVIISYPRTLNNGPSMAANTIEGALGNFDGFSMGFLSSTFQRQIIKISS